ncbi:PREDICTED: protein cornichon homolog 1 isoform X2 [Ipomoea nil]|uniref:protein cornichon homolog 1 isoform X2 n=1 Tax=Ipomoea nil TaxID=35883 RepID=UPI00090122DF|nr:PREDICTED: protein cornichon homolog 1 isoform X2 [Ipomoea nil]XP_019187317.1 PREDICTED: protein cornichon homolog 1 isoform X2 [Ipomoea nil]
MAWEPILWLIFFLLNIALIALILYQIVCLSDLEADYMNPYESSSRINNVILKEFVLQGAFCILFLVTGHWFLFLLTVLPSYYNVKKFLSRQHLIDVTEVFRVIDFEKKLRIAKLAFYLIFFIIVLVRLVISVIRCLIDDEHEDLHFGIFGSSPVFR